MTLSFRKAPIVAGVRIPRRHFTIWAALYFLVLFCLPVLGVALALDVIFYVIFQQFFDACYGLLCLIS
ncbi:MAG: hypothetical protein GKS01_00845 [Alphaproteobacteria bacterium]|nr:hypothetical protein [Alphaproteobacteria bacterium]